MKPKGSSFRPGWIQVLREQQVEAICQLSVWLSSALAAPGAPSMERPLENSVGGHQARNPRCRGALAFQGPPKSQDSCCLATLVMCTAPTFPWWFLTSHTWDSQPSWSPGTVSAPGPTGVKGGGSQRKSRSCCHQKKALGLGSERPWACSGVYVFPGAQSRAQERKRRWKRAGCSLSLPEGQPPVLACFPEAHFPHDLGGWVQVPLPSLLPLPSLSHFLGSKRATSSSSCAPHTEHTAGATVCFGLRSAQSSSFPRLIGALPRCTTRQVSPLYSSSRDSGESQKDTVGWGPTHTPHPLWCLEGPRGREDGVLAPTGY